MKSLAFILLIFCATISYSQDLDNIYTNWAETNIPTSYNNVKKMVETLWGDNEARSSRLIEIHCKSLNSMLTIAQEGRADTTILLQSLNKWSKASNEQKKTNWWEWPDTNWIRVESEYNKLTGEE